MIDMFITGIVVMVTQVYAYVQTHQIAYIHYVQSLCTNYTATKLGKE